MKKAVARIAGATLAFVASNPAIAMIAGAIVVGGVVMLAMRGTGMSTNITASLPGGNPSPAQYGRVFEAFWYVAGREEGPCNWEKWTADDVGHGVSIGWIQFNQKSGLVYLLQNAALSNSDAFFSIFGDRAGEFTDRNTIRSMDMNAPENKKLLLAFLRSNFGKEMQIKTAYQNYFKRANDYVDANKPSASDEFRVIAGLLCVQFSPSLWQSWVRSSNTAEEANSKAQQYMYGRGYNVIAKWRYPRQMANTRKALDGNKVCP